MEVLNAIGIVLDVGVIGCCVALIVSIWKKTR